MKWRTKEMVQLVKVPAAKLTKFDPWNLEWKGKNNPCKLSSDLWTYIRKHMHTCRRVHISVHAK